MGDAPPLAPPVRRGEAAVEHGHVARETRLQPVQQLRGQGDFRHQDQALPALPAHLLHGPEVDLGLAAAGDAVQQHGLVTALAQARLHGTQHRLLLVREHGRVTLRRRPGGILRPRLPPAPSLAHMPPKPVVHHHGSRGRQPVQGRPHAPAREPPAQRRRRQRSAGSHRIQHLPVQRSRKTLRLRGESHHQPALGAQERRQRRRQHLPQGSHVVVRRPAAQLQERLVQEHLVVQRLGDILHPLQR